MAIDDMMEFSSGQQQSLYSNCTGISMPDVHALVLMRGITGIVCFLLCVVSLVLEAAHICYNKGSSTVLQRFFIYVIVANLLRAAILSVDIISHKDGLHVNRKLCETIGFVSQYFASFQLLTITAMMLLLYHNLFSLNGRYRYCCTENLKCITSCRYFDVIVIFILFLIPSFYTWVPFVMHNNVYGDAGPWCWLREFDSNCSQIKAVFVLETVFWNAPFGVVLFFCFICVTVYLTFFIYTGMCRKVAYKMLKSILFESCILFVFFTFYTSLCIIELIGFNYSRNKNEDYTWMVLYAVTLPIGEISLSLTSFAYVFRILYKFCKERSRGHRNERLFPKMSEYGNANPSTRVSAKSYTSQQDRPAFISPSSEWTSILPNDHYKPTPYGSL